MKFHRASKAQIEAAKRFSDEFGISASQAVKYLDECFKLQNEDISVIEFEAITGHRVTKLKEN